MLTGFTAARGVAPVIHIAPKPAWLNSIQPYNKPTSLRTVEGGYFFQLVEHQVQVEKQAYYHHLIRQIVTDAGIQNGSEISVSFDPAFETLTFHSITVWRDNKPQQRLNAGAFKVVADEKELSDFIYQGTYTALCILDDIRKGDRIEYDYTVTGNNPIFQDKYCDFLFFQFSQTVAHQYTSLIFSDQRKLHVKNYNALSPPKITTSNGLTRYEWEDFQVKPALESDNAPSWYDGRAYAQVSQFNDWGEVARWALSINPPEKEFAGELAEEVKKLKKAAGSDTQKYFRSAVNLVQNEVRYMGIEIGQYSHRANSPGKVFRQRYGDCKDKSLLLVSILQAYGIEAHMVLANTEMESHIEEYLPASDAFNHAVVTARVAGKQVWVDATMSNQGGEGTKIYFPGYGDGLVLATDTRNLTPIPNPETGTITDEDKFIVKNEKSPVDMYVTTTYTLNQADRMRDYFASTGMAEVEKGYLDYYAKIYTKIESKDSVTVSDDPAKNVLTTVEHYSITDFFKKDSTDGSYTADFYADCIRQELPDISAESKVPVSVNGLFSENYTEKVVLPSGWNVSPEHQAIDREAYKFSSDYSTSGDTLSLNYKFSYLAGYIPVDKLDEFKQDIKRLTRLLSYSINTGGWTAQTEAATDFNQWMFNLALLLVLGLGAAGYFIYSRETPGIIFSYGGTFTPIGGWLVLIAIGLCLTPVMTIANLVSENYFSLSVWNNLSRYAGSVSLKLEFVLIVAGQVGLFMLSLFCAVLFFTRRDILPRFIIGYFIFGLALNVFNYYFAGNISHNGVPSSYTNAVFRSFVAAAIWIPYFLRSVRVKQTFIVPYPASNYRYESGAESSSDNMTG